MAKRLYRTYIRYTAPILLLWFTLLLNQPSAYVATSTMNVSQIRETAMKSSTIVENASLQQFKSIFKEYAPDTWVSTMNKIPLRTIQCMIKISKRIALKVQNNMTAEPSEAQMANKLRKNCKHGYPKVAAFEHAVNKTIQQLPESVKNIGTQFSSLFKQLSTYLENSNFSAASFIGIEFLQSVANISMPDRQQMGTLFPMFSNAFVDPRVNDLINMTILALNGSTNLMKNATNLAQDIFFAGLRKNISSNITSNSSSIMMSSKNLSPAQSLYFQAPETFDQPNQEEISNGAIKVLAVLKGKDSKNGMIEPIAHDDTRQNLADEADNQQSIALNVLPIGPVGIRTLPVNEKGKEDLKTAKSEQKPEKEVSFLHIPPSTTV